MSWFFILCWIVCPPIGVVLSLLFGGDTDVGPSWERRP
jgi:hypothetical protein